MKTLATLKNNSNNITLEFNSTYELFMYVKRHGIDLNDYSINTFVRVPVAVECVVINTTIL